MAKNYYEITLALAGICQSAYLVQQLAHTGNCNHDALHTSLNSVLNVNPVSTLAVYGDAEQNLKVGLETLLAILNTSSNRGAGAELSRYTFSLIALERKLKAKPSALDELGRRIGQLERQLEHFELLSDTIVSALAAIYVDVISTLGPRIQVTGSPEVLKNSQAQAKVRATLLAGIRSAVLWQQIGGGRLQLMFSRGQLVKEAKQILARCPSV
ncbi:high frequency lysogenization protein HflD [Pectobacterium cacticida]|uniref:High frequency lysogenization protein HflD homolog n=1 Tax=Pectobacterium cacticida TaxID=69221 RepID=A0ABZ2G7C6_9GAMM|nr:high frequency lysogenization protein HflD [Pectobacterium cacticida]UYX05370.1 high frequency lysogenization protein HflD [Pectobacterium cacticida]